MFLLSFMKSRRRLKIKNIGIQTFLVWKSLDRGIKFPENWPVTNARIWLIYPFLDTHSAETRHCIEPADRQDCEESDDVYVEEGLQHRRLRVTLRFYCGVGISHVEQSPTLLLGATTANITGRYQTGDRVEKRVVLGRQHLAYILLLEAITRDRKRHPHQQVRSFGKWKRESINRKINLSNES